jgi:DNA repair protein RecO (recombination protein O)
VGKDSRPAAIYKTSGIALKAIKLGEADKLITFITAEGKRSAVARGIRRTKSKFGGRLEQGNDLDLVLARGRTLDTITQVHISRLRPWLRSDLAKLEAAYAMFEMVEKFSVERNADDRLLRLLAAGLDRLETESRLPLLLSAFDLKLLAVTGFLPHLSSCVVCGARDGLTRFAAAEGGLVCGRCRAGRKTIEFDAESQRLIKELMAARFRDLDSIETDEGIINRVNQAIWGHIAYHVDAKFRVRKVKTT